jgi:two-component system phosphate regulon response regulator PhoB
MSSRLLLVEDEDALATLLQYNLDKEGFEVAIAVDGEQALQMAVRTRPDIMLLDWMLPGISGVEVCRRLRLGPETRNIPIVMLTARGEQRDRLQGLGVGADDYVSKPFVMRELAARLRTLLNQVPGAGLGAPGLG